MSSTSERTVLTAHAPWGLVLLLGSLTAMGQLAIGRPRAICTTAPPGRSRG